MTALDNAGRARWLLGELEEAIARLASPAEAQIAHLAELGSGGSADELALEFDDVAEAALSQAPLLSEEQRFAVRDLDRKLDEMSGADRATLWTEEALWSATEWDEVRRLGKRALTLLRQSPRWAVHQRSSHRARVRP